MIDLINLFVVLILIGSMVFLIVLDGLVSVVGWMINEVVQWMR
jgi:hypothetical protein